MVFEVLQREKSKVQVSGMAQLAFVIIGFCVLMCVEIFGEKQLSFNLLFLWSATQLKEFSLFKSPLCAKMCGIHYLYSKLRRFLFFGTMERYGTERNGKRSGTGCAEMNGTVNGTEWYGPKRNRMGSKGTVIDRNLPFAYRSFI